MLENIEERPFDLIVVGDGINGAGYARDASMRELRALMLDKGDKASGTTQWATRRPEAGGETNLARKASQGLPSLFARSPSLA